jgi:hypothetical protein
VKAEVDDCSTSANAVEIVAAIRSDRRLRQATHTSPTLRDARPRLDRVLAIA